MHWTERRERFRAILSGNRCVHPASVYDAISARIAEDLGFEVGMFSGSIGSMSVLGAPQYQAAGSDERAAPAAHPVGHLLLPGNLVVGAGYRGESAGPWRTDRRR